MSVRLRSVAQAAAGAAMIGMLTAGGAVAAGLVTSAAIQDGTVTGADVADGAIRSGNVRDGSLGGRLVRDRTLGVPDLSTTARERLRGPAGIRGFVAARGSREVAPNTDASLSVPCPDGKFALSVQGALDNGVTFDGTTGVQATLATVGATVFVHNTTDSTLTLRVQVLCGALDPRTL